MPKTAKKPMGSVVSVVRESSTGQFLAAAKRLKDTNTATPEIARSKLKELGILGKDGKLSKNYK